MKYTLGPVIQHKSPSEEIFCDHPNVTNPFHLTRPHYMCECGRAAYLLNASSYGVRHCTEPTIDDCLLNIVL